MVDKVLLLELKKVCEEVCFEKSASGGRVSAFGDDVLERIAERLPRTEAELRAIKGINLSSVSKFGGFILECVENRLLKTRGISSFSGVNKSIFEKLSEQIKDNLLTSSNVELSSRAQVVEVGDELEKFITGKIERLVVLKKDSPNFEDFYEKMVALQKENDRCVFVGGREELCLGLFRASGRLCGGILKVDTPLVLVPIKLNVGYNQIEMIRDKSRKVGLNGTIQVLNGVQNFDIDDRLHLGLDGLKNEIVERFKSAKAKFYPDDNFYGSGLTIKDEVVLECFDSLDFANLQEIEQIMRKNEINKVSDVLLCGAENSVENSSGQEVFNITQINYDEEEVLNNYQNRSVCAVNLPYGEDGYNLVQNVVSDCLAKNQNCLIVAKDKELLDVAYKKLGELSKYALRVDGVSGNNFRAKLQGFIKNNERLENVSKKEIYELIDAENCIKQKLKSRDNCLYGESEKFGSMDNFYSEVEDLMLKNSKISVKNKVEISNQLMSVSVDELLLIKRKFEDLGLLKKVLDFLSISRSYPWLQDIKRGLTPKDKTRLLALVEEYCSGNKKKIKELGEKYFVSTKNMKLFSENPQLLQLSLVNFDYFQSCFLDFMLLSENEKQVLSLIFECNNNEKIKIEDGLNFVVKSILVQKLKMFENENKDLLGEGESSFFELIDDFITIELEKNNLVRKFLDSKLTSEIKEHLVYSKRVNEISEMLEGDNLQISGFLKEFRAELFGGVKIWLVSMEELSEMPLICNLFDQSIVLDSLNIRSLNAVGIMYRSKRIINLGDSAKRVLKSENLLTDKNFKIELSFNLSLFENACDNGNFYKLKYVSCPTSLELFDFVNYSMYEGELLNFQKCGGFKDSVMVISSMGKAQESGVNGIEARKSAMVFKKVLESSKDKSVGIITLNYSQKYEILKSLKFLISSDDKFKAKVENYLTRFNYESVDNLVKTAFEMYNKHFDICILSTIVSVDKYREVEGGDVFEIAGGKELLNMAITRMGEKLIVVTSVTAEELSRPSGGTLALQIMSSFLSFAVALMQKRRDVCDRILQLMRSVFCLDETKGLQLGQLKSILETKGLTVKLVTDEYILLQNDCLIEIESVLKKKYQSVLERDLYRVIAIKKSGLLTYRLFDNKFIENSDLEIQNIIKLQTK